jgi:molybdopterin molybdotransferase
MGNDIQSGDVILSKGKQLQPQDIALAASVGVGKLEVFNKIKVGAGMRSVILNVVPPDIFICSALRLRA